MEIAYILLAILVGTLIASFMACLPALHIYNVAGIVLLLVLKTDAIPSTVLISFMMSLVVAYSILNTIPSIFLGAPDESAIFVTMPGNRALMLSKGYEATLLTGIGGIGGVAFLVLFAPLAPVLLPAVRKVLSPHMHWILATVLAFMVMSEWPKEGDRGASYWKRFFSAWKNLFAGLLTLLLSAILGFIILYKPVTPLEVSFQNIMPALVGLFAIPWVVQNMISNASPPPQHICKSLDVNPRIFLRGVGAGCLGGTFAAIFPIVTGGIGGLLSAHATAQRDERLFIISQGASKLVYYVGGFLLLFVPGASLNRGGMAWMISGIYQSNSGYGDYYLALAVICLSGALSFILLCVFTRWVIWFIDRVNYRIVSLFTFFFIFAVVYFMCSWEGVVVMIVSSGIGMIPVFFHSRRMNCMGVLIIPVMLNMSGHGPVIARWMGLI